MQELKENLKAIADELPVIWDRYTTDTENVYTCYGWIARKDGQRDFVLISAQIKNDDFLIGFSTSSAKYSAAIATILYGDTEEHNPCRPISELFNTITS